MRLLPPLLALACSACVTTRSLAAEQYYPLEEPPLSVRWALTHVSVLPPTNPDLANHSFATLVRQLEGHVRAALVKDPALGLHQPQVRDADFAVELELRMLEGAAMNGFQGVDIAGSFAGPGVGALLGAALGGPAAPLAMLIGAAAGASVALVSSTLTPSTTYSGQLEAVMTVRRASDGIEIARRTAHAQWNELLNAYEVDSKLAAAAGPAVPKLERELATMLRATFIAHEQHPPLAGR